MSSAITSTLRTFGSVAVPALPGATSTSVTRAACAHFQASACSRPPEPTIRTFMESLASPARRQRAARSATVATACLNIGSVPEMPHAGEHHRHAVLVRGGDDFIVALGAAGLDHGLDAEFRGHVQPVAEGEE